MKLRIVATQPLEKQVLDVTEDGIVYNESSALAMGVPTSHSFAEIDAVICSAAAPELSIQVGATIYRIRYNKHDANHRAVIDSIVAGAQSTVSATA